MNQPLVPSKSQDLPVDDGDEATDFLPPSDDGIVTAPQTVDAELTRESGRLAFGVDEQASDVSPDAATIPADAVESMRTVFLDVLEASDVATSGDLQLLASRIDDFHLRSAEYEANARLLHARVESLQQDQIRALLKPAFERLASLHAQASDIAAGGNADTNSADEFAFFATAIEELLDLYDLASVEAAVGARFDAKRHHAARTASTTDPDQDGTIQRVIRQGFAFAGSDRVLLPARVGVFRYAAASAGEPGAAPADVSTSEAESRPAPSIDVDAVSPSS